MIHTLINRFLFLFIALFCWGSFAQQIKRINTKEGLLYGTINVFEKDSLGFMWIGTSQGLNRYSGSGFKNYQLGNDYQFKGQEIIDIHNHNGDLYLVSNNGALYYYNYQQDNFDLLLSIPDKKFLSLTHISEHQLLIGMSNGLLIYDTSTKEVSKTLHEDLVLNRVLRTIDDKIYAATARGFFVFSFNKNTQQLTKLTSYLEGKDIIDFNIDKKGNSWVGTEVNGLYKINGSSIEKIELVQNLEKTYAIRKINFDKNQRLLVAVDRLGLFVLNENNEVVKTFSHEPDNDFSISQNSIYSIYVDNYNAIWLGLREGGLNIIYENDNSFTNIKHIKNLQNSIYNNNIRSIYQTQNGDIWYGTENGVSKYANGQWTNYNENSKLFNTAILAIDEYDGKLMLGTYGEGLLSIDPETGEISRETLITEKPLKFVFHLHATEENLWVSTSDGSLNYFDKNELVHNFKIGFVRDLVVGFEDIVYALSDAGLYKINKRNNSYQKIETDIFNTVNIGYSLNFDPLNNCLWIGAKNGLYQLNLKNDDLKFFSSKITKEIGSVYSMQRDNMQNLYLGSISGLWKYNIKEEYFRKYDEHDGMFIENFGVGASAELKNGLLSFGGPQGAIIFNPSNLIDDEPIADVFLADFKINGKQPDTTSLSHNINFEKSIQLKSNQNSLTFKFETLKYHGSKRNLFEWKLKGFDTSKRTSYGNEEILYPNLSPGKYILTYTAYNAKGLKAEENTLTIHIQPPFWNTWWAYLAYLFIFFCVAYLIVKFSEVKNQRKFNENRIKFFVEVAHDIRTPVSLIQLLVKQLANQEDVEKSIELIQRNTQNLNEYVTQLLDFQKIDRKQLKLEISQVDLKDCLLRIIEDFKPLLDENSLEIELKVKHIPVWFDVAKMKRIFYNLISNAIKYSNKGGKIKIQSFLEDKKLIIDFIDNGIGIPEKQQDMIFKRFTRGTNVTNKGVPGTGIGLMLSKKIVELHGGKILLKSKENEGSKFTVVLPNDPEQYSKEQVIHLPVEMEQKGDLKELITEEKLILLVEDNEELSKAIANELKKSYKVIEARNGKEGLLMALSKNPDVVITDVMMPVMDGKEMCHLLKTNFKTSHIPVIMLTALADVDDKVKGLETGADAYLEKPLNLPLLSASITNLLKTRENIKHILEDKETEQTLTPDESFLSEVVEIIKENIKDENFSIDTLCDIMGLSRSNLFRKLKKLIQMSPSNLIIKIKLNHAEELMKKKPNARISDIAYESGFNDPKYFSTLFKKHYNKTPKEFMDE